MTGFIKDLRASQADVLAGKHIRWSNNVNLLLCMVIIHGFISVHAYVFIVDRPWPFGFDDSS